MELFERIRRDHDRDGLSIHALARRHGVHRRTVRQALESAVPPPRKRPEGRPAPKLGEYRELIDSWLVADQTAPLKQRHTAQRVYERLVDEHGAEVSERQVRRHVRERRRALGLPVDEVRVPLCHEPGVEAEVDWGRASAVIAGALTEVFLFLMRACFSGACFVAAFPRENQQAFLEAHVAAFEVCLSQSHRSGSELRIIGGGSGGWLWLSVVDGRRCGPSGRVGVRVCGRRGSGVRGRRARRRG